MSAVVATSSRQIMKVPAIHCRHITSCGACVGNIGDFLDANCGWCEDLAACTQARECPRTTTWINIHLLERRNCTSVVNASSTNEPATIRQRPQDTTVPVGATATLSCIAQGTGPVDFTWTNHITGKIVTPSSDGRIRVETNNYVSRLVFSPVMGVDGSIYICGVNNSFSSDSRRASLQIIPYVISHPPASVGLYLAQSKQLRCDIGGYPAPSKVWFKESTAITQSNSAGLGVIITAEQNLILSDVTLKHSGNYICRGISTVGQVGAKSSLVSVFNFSAPSAGDVQLTIGNMLSLACNNVTSATYRWYKNNVETTTTTPQFSVASVSSTDSGVYTCNAFVNGLFNQGAGRFRVIVMSPPRFTTRPTDTTIGQRQTGFLTCTPDQTVVPPPTIVWLYSKSLNGERESLSGPRAGELSLAITNSNQQLNFFNTDGARQGYYFCSLDNGIGNDTASAFVTVSVPPQITQCQPNVQITENSLAEVTCTARGEGLLSITFMEGNTVLSTQTGRVNSSSFFTASYTLSQASIGMYSCRASVNSVQDSNNCSWVLWGMNSVVGGPGGQAVTSNNDVSSTVVIGIAVGVGLACLILGLLIGYRVSSRSSSTAPISCTGGASTPEIKDMIKYSEQGMNTPPSEPYTRYTTVTDAPSQNGAHNSTYSDEPDGFPVPARSSIHHPIGESKPPVSAHANKQGTLNPPRSVDRSESVRTTTTDVSANFSSYSNGSSIPPKRLSTLTNSSTTPTHESPLTGGSSILSKRLSTLTNSSTTPTYEPPLPGGYTRQSSVTDSTAPALYGQARTPIVDFPGHNANHQLHSCSKTEV